MFANSGRPDLRAPYQPRERESPRANPDLWVGSRRQPLTGLRTRLFGCQTEAPSAGRIPATCCVDFRHCCRSTAGRRMPLTGLPAVSARVEQRDQHGRVTSPAVSVEPRREVGQKRIRAGKERPYEGTICSAVPAIWRRADASGGGAVFRLMLPQDSTLLRQRSVSPISDRMAAGPTAENQRVAE